MGVQRTLGAIALILLTSAARAAPAPDLFDELYARGQKLNGDLRTLTATFVETSTSPLLTRPVEARGSVYVERPSRVALRYAGSDPRVVLIDRGRMTVSWPSAKIRTVKDVGAAERRIQAYFVDSSPSELRRHFTITAREAADRPNSYLVTMTPTRKQIREGLVTLELWLDRTTLLLSAMRMTFPGGDTKLMTFAGVVPNAAIDPGQFTVDGPAK